MTSYLALIETILYRIPFSSYSNLFVETCLFLPTTPAFSAAIWVTPCECRQDFWRQKLSPYAIVRRCFRDSCYRRMDGRTNKQTQTTAHTTLA